MHGAYLNGPGQFISNGGTGNSNGGGGAGGRVNIFVFGGNYRTGQITSKGKELKYSNNVWQVYKDILQ